MPSSRFCQPITFAFIVTLWFLCKLFFVPKCRIIYSISIVFVHLELVCLCVRVEMCSERIAAFTVLCISGWVFNVKFRNFNFRRKMKNVHLLFVSLSLDWDEKDSPWNNLPPPHSTYDSVIGQQMAPNSQTNHTNAKTFHRRSKTIY